MNTAIPLFCECCGAPLLHNNRICDYCAMPWTTQRDYDVWAGEEPHNKDKADRFTDGDYFTDPYFRGGVSLRYYHGTA